MNEGAAVTLEATLVDWSVWTGMNERLPFGLLPPHIACRFVVPQRNEFGVS